MSVFNALEYDNHQQVLFVNDPPSGLKGIIAIHDTTMGPALGGLRMWHYESEAVALRDVLRLSRGMTYKAAAAKVKLGGGKSIIMGHRSRKTPALIEAMARAIERMNGQYITGPDIGTSEEDMTRIRGVTKYVIGVASSSNGYGDPSPSTARGVFIGMKAAAQFRWGHSDLRDARVAVQGLGHVGYNLCRFLAEAGAKLWVSDIREENVQMAQSEFNAIAVATEDIYAAEVDIFAPCAFGAVLNDETIAKLKAAIIAGGANNQLDEDRHGEALMQRDIIYLPDYVVNGGGLIRVAAEWYRVSKAQYERDIDGIYHTLLDILKRARAENIATNVAADRIAEERIAKFKAQS